MRHLWTYLLWIVSSVCDLSKKLSTWAGTGKSVPICDTSLIIYYLYACVCLCVRGVLNMYIWLQMAFYRNIMQYHWQFYVILSQHVVNILLQRIESSTWAPNKLKPRRVALFFRTSSTLVAGVFLMDFPWFSYRWFSYRWFSACSLGGLSMIDGIFHYQPTILGYLHFKNPPMLVFQSHALHAKSAMPFGVGIPSEIPKRSDAKGQ